jgi:hypothetical protein
MELSALLDTFTDNLEPVRSLAARLSSEGSSTGSASISLAPRPALGADACALELFYPPPSETLARYEGVHGIAISPVYREVLGQLNGMHAFELHLFGVPPSMARIPPLLDRSASHPLDLATANRHWRGEHAVEGDLFHFGGGPFSIDERVGYFLDAEGMIRSCRKNGREVESWKSFRDFLDAELRRAEADYPRFEAFMKEVLEHHRPRTRKRRGPKRGN